MKPPNNTHFPNRLLTGGREFRLGRRMLLYSLGLFFISLAVAISVNSAIGVAPISALRYVLSRVLGPSMGFFTATLLSFFLLLQILILRRDFKWVNLAQLPAAFLYGYFVDLARFLLGDFQLPTYLGRLAMQGISFVFLAIGIILITELRLVPLPAEGLVAAITQKIPNGTFHRTKIALDCTMVSITIAVSLLFLGGFYGAREGTVLSAIFVGRMMPYIQRVLIPLLNKSGIETPNPF